MGIAVIHLVQLVPTFEATPLLGVAFVALIIGTLVLGARLLNFNVSGTRLWLPIAALGLSAIAGYAFTRVVSTPLDNQDVNNWSCTLGMAALFVEGTLVALSAYAMSALPRRHTAENATRALTIVTEPPSALVQVRQSNGSMS